ncbi:MAG: bifunctional [glutamate--ammonia ligase]-adenylyl-L-tyrosine phosphorylase/[glutamate--ammonia-ligase] adenylyltransferase [Deltaproteobacteria bacterium]|nr:bifunctional [glutamate--ammonia ligase]-adenylyl-L-tyrosine phosphorylase/[glutamate--ammonia-ligase] adenylyltransferase [Deltaproteobacteria bacterium]
MPSVWHAISGLAPSARREAVRAELSALHVAELAEVEASFATLLDLPSFVPVAPRSADLLKHVGSPGRAISAFADAADRCLARGVDVSSLFKEPVLALFLELAGSSGKAARRFASEPALAIDLGQRCDLDAALTVTDFMRDLSHVVKDTREHTEAFDRDLRAYRNRHMLRIALRELRGIDVRVTAAELADLASAAMQAALDHHQPILAAQHGPFDRSCRHVVIGMGKFGGRELNFASDIDVIYLYEHDRASTTSGLSAHQFHVRLFERVSASLNRITDQGFVFRVDLDLRPEGKCGALANSLASAERYYESWGRTWERAAWIKGRPVAGDLSLGSSVHDMMRPFVYRKLFDVKAIEAIVEMKSKIDAGRSSKTDVESVGGRPMLDLDLKLSKGGIREVEFFVQAHQLLHGGREPRLRSANTLEALADLEAAGIVSRRTREVLSNAYLFLRKVEHRLQIVEEQQTHRLPPSRTSRAQLARSLGYSSAAELEAVLTETMAQVHAIFAGLLSSAVDDDVVPPELDTLLDLDAAPEDRVAILDARGVIRPETALSNLEAAARSPLSLFHPRADESRRAIAKKFLMECFASPSPDRAIRHLPDLVRSLLVHSAYVTHLERPTIRRGVARVLGASDLLARILVSHPRLLSNVLVSTDMLLAPALEKIVVDRLEGTQQHPELALSVLRVIKQEETLRVAISDLAGEIDVARVGARLTTLAELLLEACLKLAIASVTERYGAPKDPEARLAVVGGGTLGSGEMGYRSDLDLSVIFEGTGETVGGSGAPIALSEYYTRVVQRFLSFLTTKMKGGDLYDVDMRLRPSGNQGALVASLSGFCRYHESEAQLWERQALLRSRAVAGDPELRAKVDRAVMNAAYSPGPVADAAVRIGEMRNRMERERSAAAQKRFQKPAFDLKLGRGGLVDVEFLVQYLQIQHGRDEPALRTTSTRLALRGIQAGGLALTALAHDTARRLEAAYDRLKRVQNWLRLAHDQMIDHVFFESEGLRPLALAVGYEGAEAEAQLRRDLLADSEVIHEAYRAVLGSDGR